MGVRRQPDGMSEANLQRLHPRRARQKTKWRFDATNPVVRIFPVSKNARFAHVMANFGLVVRGKRFSAHEAADPALAHEQSMPYEKCPSQM